MAGFDWNEHPQNMQCPNKQQVIACRICNRVFMSTPDLINHIDVHLVEDNAMIRRQTDQINRMLSQRGHFMGNPINPYYRPHFSVAAHLRGPPMSAAVVNPQPQSAFQQRNYSHFPPPPPPAATSGSHQVLMSHPIVPSPFRASRISQHGPVLLPGGTNMPQMVHNVPQMVHYLPTVEPPTYRNLPTDIPDAVTPQDHHNNNNNNNASDDSTEIDLTLRL